MSQHFFYPPNSATLPGSITAAQGTPNTNANAWPVKVTDGTDVLAVNVDGSINISAVSPVPVTGGLTDAELRASAVPVSVSGVATAANQATEIASLASIDTKLTSPLTVTGPLTDTQLRNSAVPVSLASVPLPSGAATEATLSSLNGKVTAVNTGAVVVSSSALPTGAATEATLSSLNGKVTAVNTGAVVVASSALPSGASTEATLSTLSSNVAARLSGSLVPSAYDYIALTYTGDNLTSAVYKTGGSGGSTVATLTLAYTGSVLDSVTKS